MQFRVIPIYYKNIPLKKKESYLELNNLIEKKIYSENTVVSVRPNIIFEMIKNLKSILFVKEDSKNYILNKLIK